MAEEKELTPEEIAKQKSDARDSALKTLKLNFWDYALPKLVTSEKYGQLSHLAEAKYGETIAKAPTQEVYDQLFSPQLASEEGAITSPYVKNTSRRIIIDAIARITAQDALELIGSKKTLKAEYKGKYVADLSEEERKEIIVKYLSQRTNDKVKELLGEANKGFTSDLEEMLAEPEAEDLGMAA